MTDVMVQVAPQGVYLNAVLVTDGNGNQVARLYVDSQGSGSGGEIVANLGVAPANIATGEVAMTAIAAQIVAARTGAPGVGRVSLVLYNEGSNIITLGGSGVAYGTGVKLLPGGAMTLETTAAVYGVCNTGLTSTVDYLETY